MEKNVLVTIIDSLWPYLCIFSKRNLSNTCSALRKEGVFLHCKNHFNSKKKYDFFAVSNVREVCFFYQVQDMSALKNVNTITIYNCLNCNKFPRISNVCNLNIINCQNYDLSEIDSVENVLVHNCGLLKHIHSIGNVKNLTISCCSRLRSVTNVENVSNVVINHCINMDDFKMSNTRFMGYTDLYEMINYDFTNLDLKKVVALSRKKDLRLILDKDKFVDIDRTDNGICLKYGNIEAYHYYPGVFLDYTVDLLAQKVLYRGDSCKFAIFVKSKLDHSRMFRIKTFPLDSAGYPTCVITYPDKIISYFVISHIDDFDCLVNACQKHFTDEFSFRVNGVE